MTKEDEEHYRMFFDMFRTDSWKRLILDLQDNASSINNVEALKDVNDMYYRKGQINVLASLINLEASTIASYEELTSSND